MAQERSIRAGRHFGFTHQVAALCYVKWRNGRHLESVTSNRNNPTPLIDAYFREEHSCNISSRFALKWRSLLGIFWRRPRQQKEQQEEEDGSVPDPKMQAQYVVSLKKRLVIIRFLPICILPLESLLVRLVMWTKGRRNFAANCCRCTGKKSSCLRYRRSNINKSQLPLSSLTSSCIDITTCNTA